MPTEVERSHERSPQMTNHGRFTRWVLCTCIVLSVALVSTGAFAREELGFKPVTWQSGTGTNDDKWRAYVTDRAELRAAWERFRMRGDLPNIGFRRRVAILAGTNGSSSCPWWISKLVLHREERRLIVRMREATVPPGYGCTADYTGTTRVVSIKRSAVPRGDLSVRVYLVGR